MKNLKIPKPRSFPLGRGEVRNCHLALHLIHLLCLSKLATPTPAINPDMLQVIDYATSAMNDVYSDASTLLDKTVPLG